MDIEELRKKIDAIDDELILLFLKRMELSKEIGCYKAQHHTAIYDPNREETILKRLTEGQSPQMQDSIKALYATIFDLSKSYQNATMP